MKCNPELNQAIVEAVTIGRLMVAAFYDSRVPTALRQRSSPDSANGKAPVQQFPDQCDTSFCVENEYLVHLLYKYAETCG